MPSPLPDSHPLAAELDVALHAARSASATIMEFYVAHSAETYTKGDGSPVTDADIAADRVIRETIRRSFPDDVFMTEEGENDEDRLSARRVWIVDPIDGTAQYVARTGRFDVLIALAVDGSPAVAVTIQPTTGLTHAAVTGAGAWRNHGGDWEPLRFDPPPSPPRLVGSRYYVRGTQPATLAAVAEALDAGPPPIMDVGFQPRALDPSERWYDAFIGLPQDPAIFAAREWDIAASDLIIHEAGGVLTDIQGRRHRYNKPDTHIEHGLLASVSPELHDRLLREIEKLSAT
jgi:myo-inositol-1(or 4)-monophosphatase